jgi:hypothetical protein
MKTTLITLMALVIAISGLPQNSIPNGDFENWNSEYSIDSWDGLNYDGSIFNFHTFSRTDDAHSGNYAAQIETISQSMLGTLPGIAFTGSIDFDAATYEYSFSLGIAVEGRPSAIKGFYKYLPVSGDSMAIVVGLFKWDEASQDLDSIGGGLFYTGNTVTEYSGFTLPLEYFNQTDQADTMYIMMFSSLDAYHAGSVLKIDDLQLEYGTFGINDPVRSPDILLFPNPATDFIEINSNIPIGNASLIVTDVLGQEIFRRKFNGNCQISLPRKMSNGIYIASIVADGLMVKAMKFYVERF